MNTMGSILTRKLFICLVVLAVAALACQAAADLVEEATSTPEPTPIPTEAEAPPEPTATTAESPPEAATPAPEEGKGSAPVVQSVDLREETADGEMTIYQDISFKDAEGDVYYVDYELKSATAQGLSVSDGDVDIPEQTQKSGATLTGAWNCGEGSYEANLSVRLYDKAGNKSTPYEYTIVCQGQEVVEASFPDPFDDNRNGWGLDEQISIENGMLQFRDIPVDRSRWVWCDACVVTPDQSYVTFDASWSNTPEASLGFLIDDNTCAPDGLIFIIGPFGYYRIMQAVRDDAGEWSHWRPFVEWTKSNLIRRAQSATNAIAAQYEFGDELHVSFFLNGSRVTRVRVYGYNGSKECRPGLFADGGLEANFDNFNISTP